MGNNKKLTTVADFDAANRYHASFEELCTRNGATEEEMEKTIRSLYPGRRADDMLHSLKKRDQRRGKGKKNRVQKGPSPSPENPIANVDTAAVNNNSVANPKLQALLDKKSECERLLADARSKLAEHESLRDQYSSRIEGLNILVSQMQETIEKTITEVLELRNNFNFVNNFITEDQNSIAQLEQEDTELDTAIAAAREINVSVSSDWEVSIPVDGFENPLKGEAPDEEISKLSAALARDARFKKLTLGDLQNIILLNRTIEGLVKVYPTINIAFENDIVGLAWLNQH